MQAVGEFYVSINFKICFHDGVFEEWDREDFQDEYGTHVGYIEGSRA